MPAQNDLVEGVLKLKGLLSEMCITSIADLVKTIPDLYSVQIPSSVSNVVVGVEQPGDSQRDNLWIRMDASGGFIGIYVFARGAWQQVYPVPNNLFLVSGDSRTPPKGFTLASDAGALTTSQKNWLKLQQHWQQDQVNTWYDLFYVIYTGF